MKLLITGATGYIGERLTSLAARDGHDVYCASRKPTLTKYKWLPFDLGSPTLEIPQDCKALVHLAADTSHNKNTSSETEIIAARALIQQSSLTGTKIIFISSQTASPDAPTSYGQTKWRIEQDILAAGGVVIRPGQVYGGQERGLFGVLSSLVRRVPAIPALLPAPLIQPIHVDDLAAAILTAADNNDIRGETLSLGMIQPISFGAFLESIATDKLHKLRLPVPLPVPLINLGTAILGKNLTARLGLDRLLSLLSLKPMQSQASLIRLGITLRPLADGMHKSGSGRRRRLLIEANTFLSYLLKCQPHKDLLRRYARAIEILDDGQALLDSKALSKLPCAVALLDTGAVRNTVYGQAISRRLHMATALAEASPQGASTFLGLKRPAGFARAFIALGMAVLKDICWRVLSIAASPVLPRLVKRKIQRDD